MGSRHVKESVTDFALWCSGGGVGVDPSAADAGDRQMFFRVRRMIQSEKEREGIGVGVGHRGRRAVSSTSVRALTPVRR